MTIVRGYCHSRDFLPSLRAIGLVDKAIWLEGRGAETLEWCLASFRGRSGRLIIAPDLRVFGQARRDIAAIMSRLERARIRVIDALHPQDETVAEMLQRAFVAIGASRFRDRRIARRRGRQGGMANGQTAMTGRNAIAPDWLVRNIVNDAAERWLRVGREIRHRRRRGRLVRPSQATAVAGEPFRARRHRAFMENNMDNQHKKISGYRDLSQDEINAMNGVKHLEAQFNGLIDHLKGMPGIDLRQVAIAATQGEDAFMRAVRAIAQPERQVSQYVPSPV
jgi:hypothetical protein